MTDATDRAEAVEQIGPYRIVEQLGAGGMGVVYRAVHTATGAEVALKTVRAVDPATVRGIRREIHALRKIRHPGVVRIVDEGLAAGVPWYAMDLVEGRSLRRTLSHWKRNGAWVAGTASDDALTVPNDPPPSGTRTVAGKRSARASESAVAAVPERVAPAASEVTAASAPAHLRDALGIVRALCDALAFIHGEGLVHRDLKPDNVIVRVDGTPVLMDFGLVGAFSGAAGREALEVVGGIEGSFGYIAPEQIRAEVVDARADLYALGCILYELATGRVPFEAEGYGVLGLHLLEEPAPPSARAPGLPASLDALILRLLRKRPADRFGYATDVARALSDVGELAPAANDGLPAPRTYLYRPEFVGRSDVVAQLEALLTRAADGVPRTVLLAGESGAGKTRLAAEIAAAASRRQFRVFTGECIPIEGGSVAPGHRSAGGGVHSAALHPLRTLLESLADQCRAGGDFETARLLGARARVLALYEPSLTEIPFVAALPPPPELPPQAARHRLFQYLAETLTELGREDPVLLVIDDLQWADELTLALLAWLQTGLADDARLMVIGTYRTEEAGDALRDLARDERVHHVQLERLDQSTVAQMAVNMLALANPPEDFVGFLTAESAGNPFFVAEYLRAAVDAGLLRRGDAGTWELTDATRESGSFHKRLGLPRTLRDLVARRLAGLSPDAMDLAAAAAVLGREFEADLLARLAGLDDARELDAGQELLRAHILEPVGAGALRFAHDKLREIAYDGIADTRRRELHRRAAERIEAHYEGRAEALATQYPALVNHWSAAGDEGRTLHYLERAGEHAFHTGAHAEAAVLLRRALALAAERARSGRAPAPDPRWEARLEQVLSEALFAVGDLAGCRDAARDALARLGHPLPATPLAWNRALLTEIAKQGAHLLAPGRVLRTHESDDVAATLDAARAVSRLSEVFYWQQQVVPMVVASLLGVNLAEQVGRAHQVRRLYASLGYLVGLARLHGLAQRYFERARADAETGEDPGGVGYGHTLESMYHLVFADLPRAEAAAQRAVDVFTALGDAQQLEIAQTMRAQPDYYGGRYERTLTRFAEIRRSARARSNTQHNAWGAFASARSLIPLGRLDEAVALLRESIGLLTGLGDRPSEILCHGLLAAAELGRGRRTEARVAADATLALARGVNPTVYSEGEGYEGAALVYLDAWEREGRARRWLRGPTDAMKGAREACAMLSSFARTYPLARAAALRCEGTRAYLEGREARANALWTESAQVARTRAMPLDEALAHYERGRFAARGGALRARELSAARAGFAALGSQWLVERVDAIA